MRVGLVAILHESNTFLKRRTTLDDFRRGMLVTGAAVCSAYEQAHHEVGGFLSALRDLDIEPVGVLAARAMPYGPLTRSCHDELLDILASELEHAGHLDGVLVAPHGATVSEVEPDFDGYWLSQLRRRFGPTVPLIGTLDPHANVSPRMVDACDALIAYRTNPHIDQRDRGREAATLMARTLRGEIRPCQRASFPPLIVNIERQLTQAPPCREILDAVQQVRARPGVLSASWLLGFPYADVAEMGSSVLAVTDRDADLAQRSADEVGELLWQRREEFVGRLMDVTTALDTAARAEGPVCLLDMGDNVGGGSPGDGTVLARALWERGMGTSFVCLCDPAAVAQAASAGVGANVRLEMGGKTDHEHGAPLALEVRVTHLGPGRWTETEPRHGGYVDFDQGPTAVVQAGENLTLMLTSLRMAPFSLRQISAHGLEPATFRYLIAKGVHAPVAAYGEVCRTFLRVNTPGVTTADLSQLEFQNRRRPMFPCEPATTWGA